LSLPIWISYMEHALKAEPIQEVPVPPGVVNAGGEWFYEEFARGNGVSSLGIDGRSGGVQSTPPSDERRNILNLFRQ
jgi:penicillin-binding protein 1A